MHTPLSTAQIDELRIELNKIQEDNMIPFQLKVTRYLGVAPQSIDHLYQFCRQENEKIRKTLENVCRFTFLVMSNFQVIWQQVEHRQGKISELRQTFSQTTEYIQELKSQNEQLHSKLSEAETYIQWIEEQKQYLDAIYNTNPNSINLNPNGSNLNRCVSESNLRWSNNYKKKSLNYEKLKEYIDCVKEERKQMEKELVNLTQRYEIKYEESRKLSLIVQHLVEKVNRREVGSNCFNSYKDINPEVGRNQFSSQFLLRALQKVQTFNSTTSLQQNLAHAFEQCHQSEISQYFDTNPACQDYTFKELNRIDSNFSNTSNQKEMKDEQIQTESQFLNNNAQTQTENKQNNIKDNFKEDKGDYKISIHISGLEDEKHANINKIIQQMHIQHQLESKLHAKMDKNIIQKVKNLERRASPRKPRGPAFPSFLNYYQQKLVSNRIKKYYYSQSDKQKVPNFTKNT